MQYTIGQKRDTGGYILVKIWKGETLEKAADLLGCVIVGTVVYSTKKEAHKALRALLRQKGGHAEEKHYDPSEDKLLTIVGKVHPGDGYAVQVSVKDQGSGPKVLIQRFRAVASSKYAVSGLGRVVPGAARRIAQLILKAAELAEGVQPEQPETTS